jgi:hypothetical protein
MSIKVNLPSGGVCSVIGLTGSFTHFGSVHGPTGSVGGPGVPGSQGIPTEYKEYMFLCKKDFGFFKSGDYITMLINLYLFGPLELKSKDSLMNFTISKTQLDEHFIWGPELRDKHIGDILNY